MMTSRNRQDILGSYGVLLAPPPTVPPPSSFPKDKIDLIRHKLDNIDDKIIDLWEYSNSQAQFLHFVHPTPCEIPRPYPPSSNDSVSPNLLYA